MRWVNILLKSAKPITHLHNQTDGKLILRLVDRIQPGIINWLQLCNDEVGQDPERNLKIAFNACVIINPRCFSSNWQDILEDNPSAIRKLLKPLMYFYFTQLAEDTHDSVLVNWANSHMHGGDSVHRIGSFEDDTLAQGVFILQLLEALKPGSIPDLVEL